MPDYADRIELYQASRPIFDLHGIEDEINRALEARVPLKSGGYLIIQQTEAMTTVDINTGAYVGHRNLEETIFNTNVEATADHRAPAAGAQPGRHHRASTSSTCRIADHRQALLAQRCRRRWPRTARRRTSSACSPSWGWWR
jgi:hypothetical protein